ncbi:MAG: aminotransferase class IV, partial [Phycisphaerales bacterium]|nr:aminotransferase class IV [Phycisphaerales bacterium]
VLFTPPARGEEERGAMPSPVLPGVTRRAIFEYASDHDLEIRRQWLTIDDLLRADEVFLTNSSWTILPVRAVEGHEIGEPGPVTRMLRTVI